MDTFRKLVLLIGPPNSRRTNFAKVVFPYYFHIVPLDLVDDNDEMRVIEEAQSNNADILVNAPNVTVRDRDKYLSRFRKYGIKICACDLFDSELQKAPGSPTSNLLVSSYKEYETSRHPPTMIEGFDSIKQFDINMYTNAYYTFKALFFDFASIIKSYASLEIYEEVNRQFKIFKSHDYKLIGLLDKQRKRNDQELRSLVKEILGKLDTHLDDICFCNNHPMRQKPKPGMAYEMMGKHLLDLEKCIMVGLPTVDKDFAANAGIGTFLDSNDFFSEKGINSNYNILGYKH